MLISILIGRNIRPTLHKPKIHATVIEIMRSELFSEKEEQSSSLEDANCFFEQVEKDSRLEALAANCPCPDEFTLTRTYSSSSMRKEPVMDEEVSYMVGMPASFGLLQDPRRESKAESDGNYRIFLDLESPSDSSSSSSQVNLLEEDTQEQERLQVARDDNSDLLSQSSGAPSTFPLKRSRKIATFNSNKLVILILNILAEAKLKGLSKLDLKKALSGYYNLKDSKEVTDLLRRIYEIFDVMVDGCLLKTAQAQPNITLKKTAVKYCLNSESVLREIIVSAEQLSQEQVLVNGKSCAYSSSKRKVGRPSKNAKLTRGERRSRLVLNLVGAGLKELSLC